MSPGSSPKAGPSCDDKAEVVSGSGYNSGDEYSDRGSGEITEAEWQEVCISNK